MNPNSPRGFTLLELTVVLAILAVVTAIAVASVETAQDQARYEATQRGLESIREAVLGSPDARGPDGTPVLNGFVSDMGRLPRTVDESGVLTLGELLAPTGATFDLRAATVDNVGDPDDADPEVLVPGGWRGPYLRLTLGETTISDGWGNSYTNDKLRDLASAPLAGAGQEIREIWHYGSNGTASLGDSGYAKDAGLRFEDSSFGAEIKATVVVSDTDGNALMPVGNSSFHDQITIRAFGPDPSDASKIVVVPVSQNFIAGSPATFSEVSYLISGLSQGTRAVRAYFNPVNAGASSAGIPQKSPAKYIQLRSGTNLVHFSFVHERTP
ncbi:MAG: prepilin-type N-terminal cleavage/methylation domain-containing protein [Planctomycetes bacterium]|nr:prepilin-type N-terminal cleavage/methylation domain-containing protein [Planctomycetota bacterium]